MFPNKKTKILLFFANLAFLSALILLYLRKILFFKGDFILQGADLVQTYYQKFLYKTAILDHSFPLWNPYLYCGYPFLAHPYNQVFYPLNLIFVFFPINLAYSWYAAMHILLAGVFMFVLVKYLTRQNYSALISALCFMFSGFTATRIWAGHFELYATSIWIPLVAYFAIRTIRESSFRLAVITALILTLQFFAGHNQTFFFTLIILFAYTIFHSCSAAGSVKGRVLKPGLFLMLILFVFFVFAAIQILPTAELIKFSTRSKGHPLFMSMYGSMPPEHLIRFIFPDFFGNFLKTSYAGDPILGEIYWEYTYYIGIIPLALAVWAFFRLLNPKTRVLLGFLTVFVSAVSVLTRSIFLYLWNLRNSHFSESGASPVISLLEGVYTAKVSIWRVLPFFVVVLAGLAAVFIWGSRKLTRNLDDRIPNDRTALFFVLLVLSGVFLAFGQYLGGVYHFIYKFIPGYNSFRWPVRHLIITNFALCVLAGYFLSTMKLKRIIKSGICFLILADLFVFGSRFFYLKDLKEFYPEPGIIARLQNEKERPYRLLTFPLVRKGCVFEPSCANFPANSCVALGFFNVSGYDPVIISRYHEFTNLMQGFPKNVFGSVTVKLTDLRNENILNMMNIRHVYTDDPAEYGLNKDNLTVECGDSQGGTLWGFQSGLPRQYFLNNVLVTKNQSELEEVIVSRDFSPSRSILLEAWQRPVVPPKSEYAGLTVPVNAKYTPELIESDIVTSSPGYFFASEVYYPGWKAFINGREAKIYRANYAFRAVYLENPGFSHVVFKFQPDSFKAGTHITVIGSLGIAVFLFWGKLFRSRKR